jgi:hypothetical protein
MEFTQFLDGQLDLFRQQAAELADQFGSGSLTPEQFRSGLRVLKRAVDGLGAASFVALVEQADETAREIVRDGTIYRHKHLSSKEWLTPWGKVEIGRGLYQPDRGGESYVPLDHRCGMVARFMSPDIEEMCVLLGTRIVPEEVEEALARVYPDGPSCKAIRRVLSRAGAYVEAHSDDLEETLNRMAPLNVQGDILVAGWDGVTVPIREPAPKRGRPAERPGVRDSNQGRTAWKEAGVGMLAVYETPLDPLTQGPERIDVRYSARMPEPKMAHLVDQVTDQAQTALKNGSFDHKVFIADGKKQIWDTVENHPLLREFTPINDFFHFTEHLSQTAEALHGKKTEDANQWYARWYDKTLREPGAVRGLIRSIKRYQPTLRKGSERLRVVTREIGYFQRNKHRMDYATYRATGLPIGSGPIEAACKTLVAHRLKRSGMRWKKLHAQEILNRRAPLLSKRWAVTWNWYLTHSTTLPNAA